MPRFRKRLDAIKTNYQAIVELRKKVKNDKIRYEIIFYDTKIGSHNIRKEKPDDFTTVRHTTGCIIEADYIAQQRTKTLELFEEKIKEAMDKLKEGQKITLEEKTIISKEVLSQLCKEVSELNGKEIVHKDGLYDYFKYFQNNDSIYKAAQRLEYRIMNSKKEIKDSGSLKRKIPIFLTESECMSGALFFERDRISKERE